MPEEEVIVYREREVVRGEGTKEKDRKEIEKSLLEGTTDEEMIMREMEEVPQYRPTELAAQTEQRVLQQPAQETISEKQVEKTERIVAQEIAAPLVPIQTQRQISSERERIQDKYSLEFIFVQDIGAGGLSRVALVQDRGGTSFAYKSLNHEAIDKMFQRDTEAKIKAVRLLRNEARQINELAGEGSAHTPKFAFDATSSDNPGIAVEYVPNSLEEKIERRVSVQEALGIFLQASNPIKRLHEKGIALMDIKPSNYRIRDNGEVVLVDLNLKRAKEATYQSESLIVSTVTDSGKTIGTPLYMAPEQEEANIKEGQEHLVDVFQLGSLLYQTLTNVRPAGVHDSLTESPHIINEIGKEKARKLDGVINKALARNPLKRQQSVDELVAEVREVTGYKFQEAETSTDERLLEEISGAEKNKTLEQKVSLSDTKVDIRDIARESASFFGTAAKYIVKGIDVLVGGLWLATSLRKVGKEINESPVWSSSRILSSIAGGCAEAILAGRVLSGQTTSETGFYAGLAFLATNTASGAYELGRHIYRKAKSRKEAEFQERMKNYNEAEVIRNIESGDFSFLAQDNELRTPEGQRRRGFDILYRAFDYGNEPFSEEKAVRIVKKLGMAIDDNSARKVLDILNAKPFLTSHISAVGTREVYYFAKVSNKRGDVGYSFGYPSYEKVDIDSNSRVLY